MYIYVFTQVSVHTTSSLKLLFPARPHAVPYQNACVAFHCTQAASCIQGVPYYWVRSGFQSLTAIFFLIFFFKMLAMSFSFFKKINYLINFWLCWVFVSVLGLSLVAASGDHSSSRCAGLSLSWPLLLRSTGSRRAGSVIVAHGPSRSAACGIFPDQGSNPCPLH